MYNDQKRIQINYNVWIQITLDPSSSCSARLLISPSTGVNVIPSYSIPPHNLPPSSVQIHPTER